jgi:hypothetical protein
MALAAPWADSGPVSALRRVASHTAAAMRARTFKYYSKPRMDASYRHIYGTALTLGTGGVQQVLPRKAAGGR